MLTSFVVVSFDPDQDQMFLDYLVEESEKKAIQMVFKYRPYATVTAAFNRQAWLDIGRNLPKATLKNQQKLRTAFKDY